jgi:hypothetical protein
MSNFFFLKRVILQLVVVVQAVLKTRSQRAHMAYNFTFIIIYNATTIYSETKKRSLLLRYKSFSYNLYKTIAL